MNKIIVDVKGKSCPIPVVEARKALRQAKEGDIIEIIGTNESSKGEIQMMINATGKKVQEIIETKECWKIIIVC